MPSRRHARRAAPRRGAAPGRSAGRPKSMVWHFSTAVSTRRSTSARETSGRPARPRLVADLHRAQHRGLQGRLALLEVEGDALVGDAPPQRQDEEARGQGEERHVGEEAEAGDRPVLVAEVVHGAGGDAEGQQRRGRARWRRRAAPTFSRQRRRTPRITLPQLGRSGELVRVIDPRRSALATPEPVGQHRLQRPGTGRPPAAATATAPAGSRAPPWSAPPRPLRATRPPCSCVTAARQLLGIERREVRLRRRRR